MYISGVSSPATGYEERTYIIYTYVQYILYIQSRRADETTTVIAAAAPSRRAPGCAARHRRRRVEGSKKNVKIIIICRYYDGDGSDDGRARHAIRWVRGIITYTSVILYVTYEYINVMGIQFDFRYQNHIYTPRGRLWTLSNIRVHV